MSVLPSDFPGFGTYKLDEKTCYRMTLEALKIGYRHLDTAQLYQNESAVAQAISDSKVPREEIFLTSKIQWKHIKQGRAAILEQIDQQIEIFGYLDLLLLHRPTLNYQEAWHVMTHELNSETVRHVGVSNYTLDQLQTLDPKPYAYQFQLNPSTEDPALLQYLQQENIVPVVYANRGQKDQRGMSVPEWLQWVRDRGCVALCQTSSETHLWENIRVQGHLSPDPINSS